VEFSRAKFCKGGVLFNGGGLQAEHRYADLGACQEECDRDPRCHFVLWKHEPNTSWVNHCATFMHCNHPEAYTDGNTALVFHKLDTPPPAMEAASQNNIGFHNLRRQQAGVGTLNAHSAIDRIVVAAAPVPASKAHYHAPGVWFACQLVDGHERMVWTPSQMVIMTKTVPQSHGSKLHATLTKFYTGKWSIEGANVLLKWNKLPPMRVNSVDGGHSFRAMFTSKARQYTCTTPPATLRKLMEVGIKQAGRSSAAARRTQAGAPTDYSHHGCRDFLVEPLKSSVFVLSRGMTLSKCFAHCAKATGMHYFALGRGDMCFCSETPPGESASPENCDLTCSGNIKENCGGFSTFASVYTMIDCIKPSSEALKEDAKARIARVRALYSVRKSHSCGRAKGNDVDVDGGKVMVAAPQQCKEVCLAGNGAGKCHGFTYDAAQKKCTFHLDAYWGPTTKDPYFSCYFKKSVPLLG